LIVTSNLRRTGYLGARNRNGAGQPNVVSDTLCMTLVYGLLVYAVILCWISFISAFPACRFV
jgi:hypothetical protein